VRATDRGLTLHNALTVAKRVAIVVCAALALALVSYVLVTGAQTGSKTRIAIALAFALGPVLLWAAIKRPILFPVCPYVMLIPFDNLLSLSRFGTLTKLLGILAGVAIFFWLVRSKAVTRPPASLSRWGLVFLWMVMSVFWAIDPQLSLARAGVFLELAILYAAFCCMRPKLADVKLLIAAIVAGAFIAAAYGSYLFYHSLNVIVERLFLSNGEDVIDPNHFAAALILPIAITTLAAIQQRRVLAKLALIGVDAVLLAGVYASGSRGGLLAIAVVFAYIFWMSRHRYQLAVVAALAVVASFFMPNPIWGRFAAALSTGGAGRTGIWRVGLDAFKQHWLLGVGLDNFPLAYDKSYLHVFLAHFAHWGRGPHNLIISTSVELGVIGLVLMLLAWSTQYLMLKDIRRDSAVYDLKIIAQASVLGLFTASMFLDVLYTKYTWLVFLVGALTYLLWKEEQKQRSIQLRAYATSEQDVDLVMPFPALETGGVRSEPLNA